MELGWCMRIIGRNEILRIARRESGQPLLFLHGVQLFKFGAVFRLNSVDHLLHHPNESIELEDTKDEISKSMKPRANSSPSS